MPASDDDPTGHAPSKGARATDPSIRILTVTTRSYRTHKPFRIARGEKSFAEQVIVEIGMGGISGRGACVPYGRYGETIDGVVAEIEQAIKRTDDYVVALSDELPKEWPGDIHDTLLGELRGAARNALDNALVDLAARRSGRPVWVSQNLTPPGPRASAITISVNRPEVMAAEAKALRAYPLLKVKLAGDLADAQRIAAVHANHPGADLIVDANESLTRTSLDTLSGVLPWNRVALIEQPLPAGAEADLEGFSRRDVLCADESFHQADDIARLRTVYGAINVKLDKAGGFRRAFHALQQVRAAGLKTMIGCMLGSSLAMAPAFMLESLADYLDLDGPLLLKDDDEGGFQYTNGIMHPSMIWGYGYQKLPDPAPIRTVGLQPAPEPDHNTGIEA